MKDLKLYTFAKITLFLDVIKRRDDNYHEVRILLHNINMWDFMRITLLPYPCFIFHSNLNIPKEENLVYKAYQTFIKETHLKFGCKVLLNKKIPLQAGLGGGSSNAAGMILGLNILTKAGLTLEDMSKIAERLGSDVPFFLYGGSCVAEGKGEILKKVKHQNFNFLLIFPPFGVSTKEIYSKIKKESLGEHINFAQIISDYENGYLHKPYNFLEEVTFDHFKELKELKTSIEKITPYVGMTGTGSTLFVVINSSKEQFEVNKQIEKYLQKGYKIKFVQSNPKGIKIF